MKNGIHFKKPNSTKLTLVESEDGKADAADYFQAPDAFPSASELAPDILLQADYRTRTAVIVLVSVSAACAAAAMATGSYAAWLSRQRAARQTLTDVSDILKSCQQRMQQLEADVQRLPKY